MPFIQSTEDPLVGIAHSAVGESHARFLVIEDCPEDQEYLLHQLRIANIHDQIFFVNDGKRAIEMLRKNELNIRGHLMAIFLDLNLKNFDGLAVLQAVRSVPELENVPVVIMTGSDDPQDWKACQKLGVKAFLLKPVCFRSIYLAIASVFQMPPNFTRGSQV